MDGEVEVFVKKVVVIYFMASPTCGGMADQFRSLMATFHLTKGRRACGRFWLIRGCYYNDMKKILKKGIRLREALSGILMLAVTFLANCPLGSTRVLGR